MNTTKKILTAAAVGAAVGLATGILVAPDRGSATRNRIADATRKESNSIWGLAASGKATVSSITERLRLKKSNEMYDETPVEDSVA